MVTIMTERDVYMKKSILKTALLCALAMTCFMGTACNNNTKTESAAASSDKNKSVSSISDTEQSVKTTPDENSSVEISEVSQNEVSQQETTGIYEDETSLQSSDENSSEKSDEASEKASDQSSDTVSVNELSLPEQYDGYYFDDEQIVKDYHTAVEFTSDEKFNSMFKDNRINIDFNKEIMDAENESDMRAVTIKYGEIWKTEAGNAYNKLLTLLEDLPEQKQKLIESQHEWESTLEETERSFKEETPGEGTIGTQSLLASDSAMMNYYKGRAAVLYQQIYVLTDSFEL